MRETDTNHCCLMSDSFVTDFHSSIELNVSSLSPLLDHRLLDMALNRQNVTINSFWKYHDQNSSLFSSCYFSVWWKKSAISNVYLGGCMITSKTIINIFWKNFLHSTGPFGVSPSKIFSKNFDFSLWGKQYIVSQKWDQNCEYTIII